MEVLNITKVFSLDGEVGICPACKGVGRVFDDSFGSGASDRKVCTTCNGFGRTKIVEVRANLLVPFNFTGKRS